jgi:hypothetical protein
MIGLLQPKETTARTSLEIKIQPKEHAERGTYSKET